MTAREREQASFDLIYLTGCMVNGQTPDRARVEKMDLESVRQLGRSLSLTAIACMALEEAYGGDLPGSDFFREWEEEKDGEIYKSLRFDQELSALLSWMEENEIWYMPLKGALLKTLYPQPGMRQMSDMDILFDGKHRPQVRGWFLARGYREMDEGYVKKPFYHFELHEKLFYAESEESWQTYYANVKDRLIQSPDRKFGYRFREEDFYVFMTVHNFKHYTNGGIGLRMLLDEYVYLCAKGDSLDWGTVKKELETLQTSEFELQIRTLSQKLFRDPGPDLKKELTEDERSFLNKFLTQGTYGTPENSVKNKVQTLEEKGSSSRMAKARYLFRRLFPEPEVLELYYPFFGRHKWLLPIGYVYRLIYRMCVSRETVAEELQALRKM